MWQFRNVAQPKETIAHFAALVVYNFSDSGDDQCLSQRGSFMFSRDCHCYFSVTLSQPCARIHGLALVAGNAGAMLRYSVVMHISWTESASVPFWRNTTWHFLVRRLERCSIFENRITLLNMPYIWVSRHVHVTFFIWHRNIHYTQLILKYFTNLRDSRSCALHIRSNNRQTCWHKASVFRAVQVRTRSHPVLRTTQRNVNHVISFQHLEHKPLVIFDSGISVGIDMY